MAVIGRDRERERGRHGATRRTLEPLSNHKNHSTHQKKRLNPADKVAIAYVVLITALVLIFSYRIPWWWLLSAGHAILAGAVILVARSLSVIRSPILGRADVPNGPVASSLPRTPALAPRLTLAQVIRGWYPVVLIPITYKELSYLIPLIHPRDFDETLARIDYRFLGAHPTVWLERFTWPPVTEILQLIYSSYYLLPVILGLVLWRAGRFKEFHFWVFIVVTGFYLSYVGYIAVPAIGPRFLPSIVEAQTVPLKGVWLFESVREMLDKAEGITRDCFPSGHTEITLLVLIYARKFHRKVFRLLLPLGTGVIISTVYLRYHYVIDVVAGGLTAVAVVMIAKPLYRRLGGNKARESH